MLRLRSSLLSHLLSSSSNLSAFPLASLKHRLLSTATQPPISPNPGFAVEDYLVATCGLARPQAIKASAKLSHLKYPSKPDAVLAFLADLGLSAADVATAVTKDPVILCSRVESTLARKVAELTGLGLSRPDIARLIPLAPYSFRSRSIASKLQYYLSVDSLLRVLKYDSYLFGSNLERTVKRNVAFLRECGLDARDIAKLCVPQPRLLNTDPERVRAMVAWAEALGAPRGSGMFRRALRSVLMTLSEGKIATMMIYLKTLGWSDADLRCALSRAPQLLNISKEMLRRRTELLVAQVGLEPAYIARRPLLLCFSLEGRLRPRYYVIC